MNQKTRFLWIYSIALFTVALALICISAFTQNRISRDAANYKQVADQHKGMFEGAKSNIATLTDENQQLKLEVAELTKRQNEIEEQLKTSNEYANKANEEKLKIQQMSDNLTDAKACYEKKLYKEGAALIKVIDPQLLGPKNQEIYNNIADTLLKKASMEHYNAGYKQVVAKKYDQAYENLQKSLEYKDQEVYSDDALYYSSVCQIELDNKDAAEQTLNRLVNDYPSSTYVKAAKNLLDKING